MDEQGLYSITDLATATGVSARSIRFYESKGLLEPRRVGTTRVFGHRDRARLQLILRGKQLGFSLADIRDYLALYSADPLQAEQQRHLLVKVRERIARLESQREALEKTLLELGEIEQQAVVHLEALEGSGRAGTGSVPAAGQLNRGSGS